MLKKAQRNRQSSNEITNLATLDLQSILTFKKNIMKEWFEKHWKDLLIAMLTAALAVLGACGSAWTLEGNQINVNNQNKCQNDTIKNEIREIP